MKLSPIEKAMIKLSIAAPGIMCRGFEPDPEDDDPDNTTMLQLTSHETCLIMCCVFIMHDLDFIDCPELLEKIARADHRINPCGNPDCEFN